MVKIADYLNYSVNEEGDIYSHNKGRNLSQLKHNSGYHSIMLYVNNVGIRTYVHRIVAQTFIRNPFNKETVNHLDGDKSNNSVKNLEWATRSENSKHAYDLGLLATPINKLSPYVCKNVEGFGYYFPSLKDAHLAGFDFSSIRKVVKGYSAHCGGYLWYKL